MEFRFLPVTLFQQNCTLLWCTATRRAVVVDPGGEAPRILRLIAEAGVTPELILLTHGHLDHVGAVADLVDALGIPVWGPHREDSFLIDSLDRQCEMFGVPLLRHFQPDRWLDEGDTVTVGESTLEVLRCPGHTPGSIVFFNAEDRLALVGDVIFRASIGRTDFPRSNHRQLLESIGGRLFPLGDDVRFISGHGPMSTFGEERRTNPFVRSVANTEGPRGTPL